MRYLILITLVWAGLSVNAQHTITLEGGHAIPAGQLGAKSGKSAGFAESAFGYGINYRYQFSDQLGVAVSGSYQKFQQAKKPISRSLDDRSSFVVSVRTHKVYGGFMGPSYRIGDKKSGVTLAFMAGYMGLDFGGYNGSFYSAQNNYTVNINKPGKNTAGLAYKTRLNYDYRVYKWLGISLSANLAYFSTDFAITRTAKRRLGRELDSQRQPGPDVLIFRPSIGLSINL